MSIQLADVFEQRFSVNQREQFTTPKPKRVELFKSLVQSLELAQNEYEKNFKAPTEEIMRRSMTE